MPKGQSPNSIKNLKHQRTDRLQRQPYTDRVQFRVSPAVAEQLDRFSTQERNDLLRQWVESGLQSHLQSEQSDLADDLVDELSHGVSETPELNDLVDLCGGCREDAVEVVKAAVKVDYHHPLDWVSELAKAYALVAAFRLGWHRQAESIIPTP